MAGELEGVVRDTFAAIDRMDLEAVQSRFADGAQSVDEISRRWLRGKGELTDYMKQLEGAITGVRTELRDVNEQTWGDAGLVTCWLEQDYTLEGAGQHISAPTTCVFRREGGDWKIALFHSVPIDESS
jgi:ketosteroid isomerase-like protein